DEERADETTAEIGQAEPLGLEIALGLGESHHEVEEGLIGASPIDRERGDPGADDDREREEALADDLAERLEAADAFADALEPAIGAYGIEGKLLTLVGHFVWGRTPSSTFTLSRSWALRNPRARWV